MSTESPHLQTTTNDNSPFDFQRIFDDNRRFAVPASTPSRRLAIVTCMDAWVNESDLLCIRPGEAHVIRNAGGNVKDALRSLVVSQQMLRTNAILVMKHTGCGMEGLQNSQVVAAIAENPDIDDKDGIAENMDFLGIEGPLEDAVRNSVAYLRDHALILSVQPENIQGCILDRETRLIKQVD
ncbi:carbonic anhydrase [Morchella snyderi]|nr:carbonic anhydrase [Morchella snyderi]